ncbi:MAG: YncE family protein, partial [Halocynthiibacter sp.]
ADKAKKKHKMKMSDGMKAAGDMVSTVSVISIADAKVVRTIEVPGAVHHVAVSPNGRFAVVTHPKNAAISAIDLTSYKVVATVPTGPMPNYAVFSPDGASVYVSNAGNNTISQVATAGWEVKASIGVGGKPEHIVLSGDGSTLYVSNIKSGTVSVVSAEQRKVVDTYQIGGKLHGLDLSDDGKTLFVAARGTGKLARVDLATGSVTQSELSPSPYHLAAVRGTGKLYISSGEEPKMWVVDQKTTKVLKEIPIGGRGHQLAQGVSG